MGVEDPWKPFQELLEASWEYARMWKEKTGCTVIGHLLPDVPEEIIHAAGALPIAVQGAGIQVALAQAHLPGYSCSHAMGAIEMGMRGDLDVLDGMVIPYVCDTTRNLYHIWNHCFPHMANEFLRLPKRIDHQGARDYLRAEFTRLFEAMARITGKDSDPAELAASVKLYDRSRELLRKGYELQREQPGIWTSAKVHMLFASALRAPREEHLKWMEKLPWDEKIADTQERIPIYVRGKVWDPPGILDLLDRLGLLVVQDEMVTGYRTIAGHADSNGDPIEVLVSRHLAAVPYAGYHQQPSRMTGEFLDRVLASEAKGVIFLNPKFCEAAGFDTPDYQKVLQEADIPSLILETSARGISLGQLQVRLEAFREMISGDLP